MAPARTPLISVLFVCSGPFESCNTDFLPSLRQAQTLCDMDMDRAQAAEAETGPSLSLLERSQGGRKIHPLFLAVQLLGNERNKALTAVPLRAVSLQASLSLLPSECWASWHSLLCVTASCTHQDTAGCPHPFGHRVWRQRK